MYISSRKLSMSLAQKCCYGNYIFELLKIHLYFQISYKSFKTKCYHRNYIFCYQKSTCIFRSNWLLQCLSRSPRAGRTRSRTRTPPSSHHQGRILTSLVGFDFYVQFLMSLVEILRGGLMFFMFFYVLSGSLVSL